LNIPLTPAQQSVAEAPADTYQLVLALPGTGKTHTLIARAAYLVEHAGLSPGGEVLILSFSRAAVGEVRARITEVGGHLAYVRAVTFDSFATRMLAEVEPNGLWIQEGYDGRIRLAAQAIETNAKAKDYVARFEHVLIDEIQDVLGERLALSKAILQSAGGGFTVFGDPAQGIYGFRIEGEIDTPWAMIRWMRQELGQELDEQVFTDGKRYEAGDVSCRAGLWAGPALLGQDSEYMLGEEINYKDIFEKLAGTIIELQSWGTARNSAPRLSCEKTIEILTRTNAEALLISRDLWRLNISHQLGREAADRVLPRWPALLLKDLDTNVLGHDAMLAKAQALVGDEISDPEGAWRALKRIEGRASGALDLDRVRMHIALGAIPDDLTVRPAARLQISTIHRAKGRQFDIVALAMSPEAIYRRLSDSEDVAEEARVVFVGLSRAKDTVVHLDPPGLSGYCIHEETDRWVKRFGWRTSEFEVKGDDTLRSLPPGLSIPRGDPVAIQEYIRTDVHEGDPVELKLEHGAGGESGAVYGIYHRRNPVGAMGEEFLSCLSRVLRMNRGRSVRYPAIIDSLFVEAVDTTAGVSALVSQQAGLGRSGVWLRVRIQGLGQLHF